MGEYDPRCVGRTCPNVKNVESALFILSAYARDGCKGLALILKTDIIAPQTPSMV